jgi:hypothetical protein
MDIIVDGGDIYPIMINNGLIKFKKGMPLMLIKRVISHKNTFAEYGIPIPIEKGTILECEDCIHENFRSYIKVTFENRPYYIHSIYFSSVYPQSLESVLVL